MRAIRKVLAHRFCHGLVDIGSVRHCVSKQKLVAVAILTHVNPVWNIFRIIFPLPLDIDGLQCHP